MNDSLGFEKITKKSLFFGAYKHARLVIKLQEDDSIFKWLISGDES